MIPKSWNQISPSLGRSGEERVVTLWSRGRRLYVLLFLGIDTFLGLSIQSPVLQIYSKMS